MWHCPGMLGTLPGGLLTAIRGTVLLFLAFAGAGYSVDTAWVRLYDGPNRAFLNRATELAVDGRGHIFVSGGAEAEWPGNSDMLIGVYRTDGTFLHARSMGGIGNERINDIAYGLAIDEAGDAYAVGFSNNEPPTRGDDISLIKVRLEADTLARVCASKTFWPGDDRAFDIVLGRYGDLYTCGADHRDTLMPELSSLTVIRSDPRDAGTIWSRSLVLAKDVSGRSSLDPYPGLFDEWRSWDNCALSMAVTPEGDIVVAGVGTNIEAMRDAWVMKFDTAGNQLWSTTWSRGETFDDVLFDVAVADDRSIYACGLTESVEYGTDDLLVLRLADTGGVLGSFIYNAPGSGDGWATQLVLDDQSPQNVYVTGSTETALRGFQMLTQKLDHDLVPQWGFIGAQFGWAGDDFGYDIAYLNHRVYVAGTVSDNIRLVCYPDSNQNGNDTLWTYTYDLPDHLLDYGSCLCVVDTNEIYMGGECDRIDSTTNWTSMFLARLRTSPGGVDDAAAPVGARGPVIPNPVTCHKVLALAGLPADVGRVEVFDAAGRRSLSAPVRRGERCSAVLDVRSLRPGLYLLRLSGAAGRTAATTKLVVQ